MSLFAVFYLEPRPGESIVWKKYVTSFISLFLIVHVSSISIKVTVKLNWVSIWNKKNLKYQTEY